MLFISPDCLAKSSGGLEETWNTVHVRHGCPCNEQMICELTEPNVFVRFLCVCHLYDFEF